MDDFAFKTLITKQKIIEAIQVLKDFSIQIGHDYYTTALLIESDFKKLKQDKNRGVINYEQESLKRNQINERILEFYEEIKDLIFDLPFTDEYLTALKSLKLLKINIKEIILWDYVDNLCTEEGYEFYLKKYSTGFRPFRIKAAFMLKMLRNENLYERFRIKVVGIVDNKKNITLSYLKNQVKNFEDLTKDIHKASAKLLHLKRNKYGKNWILRERRTKKGFLSPYPNLQLIKGNFLEIIDLELGKFVLLENGLVIHKDKLAHHLKIREEFVEEFPEENLAVITKEEIPFFKEGVIQASKKNNIETDEREYIPYEFPSSKWVAKHLPIPFLIQLGFWIYIYYILRTDDDTTLIGLFMFMAIGFSSGVLLIQLEFGFRTLRNNIIWYYISVSIGLLIFIYMQYYITIHSGERVDKYATSLGGVLISYVPTFIIGQFFKYRKYVREDRNFWGTKRKTKS